MNRVIISTLISFSLVCILIAPSVARDRNEYNSVSLHQAIIDGDIEQVKTILSSGIDINVRNRLQGTPLHTAVEEQQKQIIQLLLDQNAEVDPINNKGQTPLHIAVTTGQKDIVELLISKRADINIVDAQFENPLTLAKKGNHTEIAELLVKHGATEPNLEMDEYGIYGDLRGQERPGAYRGIDGDIQCRPGMKQTQPEHEVYILADTNEIKARIKTFEGLEKSIEEIAENSRLGMRRWQQIRTDNRSTLVRMVQRQLEDEVEFIKKLALEAKAKKTADAADTLLAKKKDRRAKIVKELTAQEKEQQQTRTTARSRGRSTRGARGTGAQNSRYTGQSGIYTEQPVARRGATSGRNTSTADDEPVEQVDPEEQNEINQWLQADVQDYDGKVSLFTAINGQIQADYIVLRNLSEQEKAKKTTTAIDGLLLARKLRYDELNRYIQEEKTKLEEQEESEPARTRGNTTGQENQTGARRRR